MENFFGPACEFLGHKDADGNFFGPANEFLGRTEET